MRKLILLFAFFQIVSVDASEVELTVQTGHAASITSIKFSPDDQLIASAGADNKIVLWDFATSKQYATLLGHEGIVNDIFFLNSTDLFSVSADSTLRKWELITGSCLKTVKFPEPLHTLIPAHEKNKLIICGKQVYTLDLTSWEYEHFEFKAKHGFTAIASSATNKLLAFGGKEEDFAYLIDLESNTLLKKIIAPVTCLKFNSDATELFIGMSNGKLISYNLTDKKSKGMTTDWMLNSVNDIELKNDRFYVANNYGEIRILLNNDKWSKESLLRGKRDKINSIRLSHDGRYLAAAGDHKSVVVWDLEKEQVVKVMEGLVYRINDIAFSNDGAEILVGYDNGIVRKTNLISNQTIVNQIKPKSELLGLHSTYSVVRIESFTEKEAVFTMLYKKNSFVYENAFDLVESYRVTWNLEENLLSMEKSDQENEKITCYTKDLKRGIIHDNYYFLDTTLTRSVNDSLGVYVQIDGNELYACYSVTNKLCFRKKMNHSDIVTAAAINPRYGYIATASWDGMIRFWDAKTGDLLTVYGAFGNGQFVYLHPDGYYFASKNALDYIGFKIDNQLFAFEQFDLKYNRPDLVARRLPFYNEAYVSAYYGAYLKRLNKLGISEEQVEIGDNLPTIEIEHEFKEGEELDELTLKITCRDKKYSLDKVHLKVNGVPEFSRFGKQVDGSYYSETYTLQLNPGSNIIQAHVTNVKGVSSFKHSLKVESLKKKATSNLFLITVGVSEYQQKQYNLSYASKDAEDINAFFNEKGNPFSSVNTVMLKDADVTLENVELLKEFVSQAGVNDVVILFAAGHGVLDAKLDYYFASHNMDFQDPATLGIPYELFEEIMDLTKSRKKVMFIDACHSGEIDKDEVIENIIADEEKGELIFRGTTRSVSNKYDINSFDLSRSLFADMRLNNGSTVVSSAGGSEFAIEGDQWNNGVFTYTFLKGLREQEADLNNDKVIMLSELQTYIQFEVSRITNGLQTPTSRVENLNNDFRMR